MQDCVPASPPTPLLQRERVRAALDYTYPARCPDGIPEHQDCKGFVGPDGLGDGTVRAGWDGVGTRTAGQIDREKTDVDVFDHVIAGLRPTRRQPRAVADERSGSRGSAEKEKPDSKDKPDRE